MSAEVENPPANQNAQAQEDAQKLLAELKGENGAETQQNSNSEEANGTEVTEKPTEDAKNTTTRESDSTQERGGHRSQRGGRGRGGYRNGRNARDNIKSDLTTQEITDDPAAIVKQVEFYFSDSNLPMDKFLFGKVGGSENNPVDLKTIHSFKRMRHFQPFEAIVEALKTSTFLELTDDNTAVKRKEPLPESVSNAADADAVKLFEDKAMPRSVYVKGFGEEEPGTQFEIEGFFTPYGPTNAIRLRRTDDKIFKRSVFVEFETEDLAQKFLELDPKPKFRGKDLLIMSKKEYCDKKIEDIKSGKIKPNQRGHGGRRFDNKNGRNSKKRDNEDDRDWRQRRDEDRKNGFRDDKRRNNRDRDFRSRGDRDGRVEKDANGVPIVKASTGDEGKSKQETQKAEALAKARAAVERENERDQTGDVQEAEANSKKRAREADDVEETERDAKKQDVKTDV